MKKVKLIKRINKKFQEQLSVRQVNLGPHGIPGIRGKSNFS
jgi:hypothetical protein